jgi:hypothetical protein
MTARGRDEWLVEVPCMECGAREFEVTRPGWTEGLGDWLRLGGRWRPRGRVCRRCGSTSGSRSFGVLVPSRRGWWSLPVELFQAVRRRRAVILAPASYLAAVVAGTVGGAAAQLLLGWSWWVVAAGVVAAVWLFSSSTAFWGAGGSDRSLATDLLRVVRPRRAIERDHQQAVERFRAAPFPLYGLPAAWPGPRHLGRWEGGWVRRQQRPLTTALSLAHGDPPADQEPQLRVEVLVEHLDPEQVVTVPVQGRFQVRPGAWKRRLAATVALVTAPPNRSRRPRPPPGPAPASRRPLPARRPAPHRRARRHR